MNARDVLKASAVALLGGALATRGAGMWVYERGTPDNMTAVAGRAALALDASTASTNPAGMTRLDQRQMVLGLQPMYMDSQFDTDGRTTIAGDDGGQAGGLTPAGAFYAVFPISDRLRLGWTTTSAYGAALDYGSGFVGRYTAMDVSLLTLTAGPAVGYRVNDWFSIGASAFVTYAALEQNVAVPTLGPGADGKVTLEDWTVGYGGSVGVLLEPREGTRVGLTYVTPTTLEFEDVLSSRGLGAGLEWMLGRLGLSGGKMDMDMTIPQGAMLSAFQDLSERWAVVANLGWQDTSAAGRMDVTLAGRDATLNRRFNDTWHLALGARCRLNETWTWGAGVAYDSSPVDDDDRTVDMPLDRQWRYATGVEYTLNERQTIGLAYTLVDLGNAAVDQTYGNGARMAGELEHDYLHIVTLTWTVAF